MGFTLKHMAPGADIHRQVYEPQSFISAGALMAALYMEMVYGLDTTNERQAWKPEAAYSGWFGVCLPIKTNRRYGLGRKSLEQHATLMLQTQKTLLVF